LGERDNVADQFPDVTSRLHRMLRSWREVVGAKLPTVNPISEK
jgi:hypothetical protein